jgi:hypothetical protein
MDLMDSWLEAAAASVAFAVDLTDAAARGAASHLAEAPRRAASPSRLAEAPAAEPPSPVSWRHLAVEERRGTKAGLRQERHLAMLPTAVESATLGACCCCRRRLALLPFGVWSRGVKCISSP